MFITGSKYINAGNSYLANKLQHQFHNSGNNKGDGFTPFTKLLIDTIETET